MSAPLIRLRDALVEGVAVVDLLPREITEPDQAARLGEALRSVVDSGVSRLVLIDASATRYLSSTAFAALLKFGLHAKESGGRAAICRMDPLVRFGANIIRLGEIVPILDDEATALASLIV
jgi:anti-sigma B factor antagonist